MDEALVGSVRVWSMTWITLPVEVHIRLNPLSTGNIRSTLNNQVRWHKRAHIGNRTRGVCAIEDMILEEGLDRTGIDCEHLALGAVEQGRKSSVRGREGSDIDRFVKSRRAVSSCQGELPAANCRWRRRLCLNYRASSRIMPL